MRWHLTVSEAQFPAPKPRATLKLRIAGYSVLALLLIGFLPFLGLKFGFPFKPSADWVIATRPYAWALAGIYAVGGMIPVYKGLLKQKPDGLSLNGWLTLLFAPFLFGSVGMVTISTGIPMVIALMAGSEVELSYTVTNLKATYDRQCHKSMERLKNLPLSA